MTKKIDKQAREILNLDDDHEFWRSSASRTIVALFDKLVALGVSKDDASEVIAGAYSVASGEYGN